MMFKKGYKKDYHENGKLSIEMTFKNGKPDGLAKAYDESGKLIQQATF